MTTTTEIPDDIKKQVSELLYRHQRAYNRVVNGVEGVEGILKTIIWGVRTTVLSLKFPFLTF